MSDEMYLIPEHGELVALKSSAYAKEAALQALLADYPELLAGGQITPDDPRRWLLINREKGLTEQEAGANRWSVDHLFIDHDGIPTIVEVKRSSNTQIRREIVGQMLDYAANGLRYWPVEHLRSDLIAGSSRLAGTTLRKRQTSSCTNSWGPTSHDRTTLSGSFGNALTTISPPVDFGFSSWPTSSHQNS